MLTGVLLHVIAPAVGVDRTAHDCAGLQILCATFNDVEHVSGLFVFGDFLHANPRQAARAWQLQPAGVEHLSATGGIERRAVESDRGVSSFTADSHHASFELGEKGVSVVEAFGQGDYSGQHKVWIVQGGCSLGAF